ncbi:alpha,alpha-trehalose-phosphate synthase (UDP-forming) [Emcibacter sp. SYSU 3D8]|uniref:alpha,alpha-trehalose-phosphate synthase (UDP-forming) n=1 Tax=Emcibacter sp. SYSU 3D8 TaxID=3133969 RepID=UPI0031FF0575
MSRLVCVSNRVAQPGKSPSRAGGLAVALREAMKERGGLWFGWSGDVTKSAPAEPRIRHSGGITYATIDLTEEDHRDFYEDFSNGVLWPLFHHQLNRSDFHRSGYEGYLRANKAFARHLAPLLQDDDLIWIHDYHFIPLAAELRRLGVRNRIGFFLHIPFPAAEMLTALPVHRQLVSDLCKYDLIGLQTEDDVRALMRYLIDEEMGSVSAGGHIETLGRSVHAAAFPIGIDTDHFSRLAHMSQESDETRRLRESLAGRALVIGTDRLDYSKGIPQRLEAFEKLMTDWPEHRSRVTFMQVAPVSRGELSQYRSLRQEIEGLAGHINGRFAEFDWTPVRYLNKALSRDVLAGFFRSSRVGFVTPVRDGMNLVAKEYVAAQNPEDPGVLVLSRFAGAARELTDALLVNPYDVDAMAAALNRALTMPLDERIARWTAMHDVVSSNTITVWHESYVRELARVRVANPPRDVPPHLLRAPAAQA